MERKLEDLVSYLKTEIEKKEKELDHIRKVNKDLDHLSQTEPILGDDIPKASDVAPEGGHSFRPTGKRNMEPDDDDDEMKTYEGESSKSGGADDA
ncbi:hypothetical protein Bca52824_069814 [Brassica carinata]|uniref:Uncharacterized protein n=1 Tax=Brassica carinata TaxID=52824 RepID=A0A8X7Q5G0_BRACI|nr:hypothetical protein Bca52824_069814 [Brassica carinata]